MMSEAPRRRKGFIKTLDRGRTGTRVRLVLPQDIPGLMPVSQPEAKLTLEQMDFFAVVENRRLILEREGQRCFYCLASLTSTNRMPRR